jgi:dipeptidyl-peptidase-3
MQRRQFVPSLLIITLVSACTSGPEQPPPAPAPASATAPAGADRKYLLETVDDAAVVQLYADGFDALSLREKTLIYHLYQAALAGRDIFIDQKHRYALEIRSVLEAVITHPQGLDAGAKGEIERYTKLFWINNGPYNNLTARKFVLKTPPAVFTSAVKAAVKAGATVTPPAGESLDAMLTRLTPMLFDPEFEPMVTNKAPGPGKDILLASANNLYSGVSFQEAEAFKKAGREKNGLNSRLVKQNGKLLEEVYKVGGRYSTEITAIVTHLEAAIPFAPEPTANALRALIQWYRSGDDADRAKYDIAWVADKDSTIDVINGFIEVYLDARGVKGGWESLVFFVNKGKTERIRKLADNAQWFEDQMPFDPKYRKANVKGIIANAIDVVVETGDSGPVTPIGINLPNDQKIREEFGSKSVSLSNVNEAYDKSSSGSMRTEFSWTPEEAERTARFGTLSGELTTDMHEVIGHASGQQAPGFKGTPQAAVKEHFSALEEGRADLIALYFIADPKLGELGVVPAADQEAIARAEYEAYTRNAIVQLRRVREGTQIEEDHLRNRQMVVRWLMANTKAIAVRQRDNKTFYEMVDAKAFRDGIGRLLAEVQRIKSEGDYAAAAKLFDDHGIHFDPKLRDEVVTRVDALKLPSYTGFVMPELTAERDAQGAVTDVKISYPLDLTAQMLRYSGARK